MNYTASSIIPIPMSAAGSMPAMTQSGRVKKKPGRKPNPASPALRKAQNRAAQRAFRERKEKHMKELEVDSKRWLKERDFYYKKYQQLSKETDMLKCENWYLKGIVLSLHLVCFKSKVRIPKHTPHVDEKSLQIMAESAPASIAAYLDISRRNVSPARTDTNEEQHEQPPRNNCNNSNTPGDGHSGSDNYHLPASVSSTASSHPYLTTVDSSVPVHGQLSLSGTSDTHVNGNIQKDPDENDNVDIPQPIMLKQHVVSNNIAAIQTLRLRLRLESALGREKASSYANERTLLQLTVPHDARIDLIPTVHMRDRMILFREQFDLDDCLKLLVNEALFIGGDPGVAGNWILPDAFFDKYWFLTIDYTLERRSRRWRQLKSMMDRDEDMSSAAVNPRSFAVHDLNVQRPSHQQIENSYEDQHGPTVPSYYHPLPADLLQLISPSSSSSGIALPTTIEPYMTSANLSSSPLFQISHGNPPLENVNHAEYGLPSGLASLLLPEDDPFEQTQRHTQHSTEAPPVSSASYYPSSYSYMDL